MKQSTPSSIENMKNHAASSDSESCRRRFLIELGSGTVIAFTLPTSFLWHAFAEPPEPGNSYQFFTENEAMNVITAIDTLIPRDELSRSASDLGVHHFIDRQLAGPFGAGARLYKEGPIKRGTPAQGLQDPTSVEEE